jgi:hypothetical protein
MKKWIGFGILLALIVVPVSLAHAQDTTINLFPIAFGTFAGHDTFLAVTNLTQTDFVAEPGVTVPPTPPNPITIRSASQGGTVVSAGSDLDAGETRVYASNSSVNARNFGCTDDICTVTVCAPALANESTAVPVLPPGPMPVISSALFWLNNGQFYAITTPIIAIGVAADCADFGVPGTPGPGTPVIP